MEKLTPEEIKEMETKPEKKISKKNKEIKLEKETNYNKIIKL